MEEAPRFELGIKDLQSSALPLGYASSQRIESISKKHNSVNATEINFQEFCPKHQAVGLVNISRMSSKALHSEHKNYFVDCKINLNT